MKQFRKTKTNLIIWESDNGYGIKRINVSELYNFNYKRNVWWTKVKSYLNVLKIKNNEI